MRAQLTRQEHAKSAPTDEKKTEESPVFSPAHSTGVGIFSFRFRRIRVLASTGEICTCKSCIPAAVWQWFTENDENLVCCSMPKCVFPENGDDSSGALGDLQSSGKQQIAAVLGNDAIFHSPQALHHRNPRPAKAFLTPKCVFPERGCDSAAAFFPEFGQYSASFGPMF